MLSIGRIISLCTFPGVILHELAHRWFCWLFGVPVRKVCYFRFGNPAGYVVYDSPEKPSQQIWICAGPFFFNSIIGVAVANTGSLNLLPLGNAKALDYVLVWLGISIAAHAFPSTGDAKTIWRTIWSRRGSLLTRIIGTPIVAIIYLGALGSFFWLDLIYGIALVLLVPRWLTSLIS